MVSEQEEETKIKQQSDYVKLLTVTNSPHLAGKIQATNSFPALGITSVLSTSVIFSEGLKK